ncbi:hypothetical protein Hanom_Chr06g00579241 [Helianthus anomalus]
MEHTISTTFKNVHVRGCIHSLVILKELMFTLSCLQAVKNHKRSESSGNPESQTSQLEKKKKTGFDVERNKLICL